MFLTAKQIQPGSQLTIGGYDRYLCLFHVKFIQRIISQVFHGRIVSSVRHNCVLCGLSD